MMTSALLALVLTVALSLPSGRTATYRYEGLERYPQTNLECRRHAEAAKQALDRVLAARGKRAVVSWSCVEAVTRKA